MGADESINRIGVFACTHRLLHQALVRAFGFTMSAVPAEGDAVGHVDVVVLVDDAEILGREEFAGLMGHEDEMERARLRLESARRQRSVQSF